MSTVLEIEPDNLFELIDKKGSEIGSSYQYNYLGVNDLFIVGGKVEYNQVLGRNTYYDYDSISKAKNIVISNNDFDKKNLISEAFTCTLIFFCTTNYDEKFTLSVLTIVKSNVENLSNEINQLSKDKVFLDKVKSTSKESFSSIEYMGIENIFSTDLKLNVFQTFVSDFKDLNLDEELLSEVEVKDIFEDILS